MNQTSFAQPQTRPLTMKEKKQKADAAYNGAMNQLEKAKTQSCDVNCAVDTLLDAGIDTFQQVFRKIKNGVGGKF